MSCATVLDTETTGIDEPDVIELAWMGPLHAFSPPGQPVERLRFKPGKPITLGALAAHHILDSELAEEPPWEGSWAPPAGTEYLIGHNVDYDWRAIGSPNVKRICTLAFARSLWPEVDSHSLGAMTYHLAGSRETARELLKGAHGAVRDVELCVALLTHILVRLSHVNNWEQLWQESEKARVPTVMPFGKHKGVPIRAIPSDYKRWLLGQPDVDAYLAKALRGA